MSQPTYLKSGYQFYMSDCAKEIPRKSFEDIARSWQDMDQEKRQVYLDRAQKEKDKYVAEMKNVKRLEQLEANAHFMDWYKLRNAAQNLQLLKAKPSVPCKPLTVPTTVASVPSPPEIRMVVSTPCRLTVFRAKVSPTDLIMVKPHDPQAVTKVNPLEVVNFSHPLPKKRERGPVTFDDSEEDEPEVKRVSMCKCINCGKEYPRGSTRVKGLCGYCSKGKLNTAKLPFLNTVNNV